MTKLKQKCEERDNFSEITKKQLTTKLYENYAEQDNIKSEQTCIKYITALIEI